MISLREQLDRRFSYLERARAPYEKPWSDVLRQVSPYRLDLNILRGSRYGGQRRDYHILNNHPVRVHRTLGAGLMASVTSPAKKWHRLALQDPELSKFKPVQEYLEECTSRIDSLFHTSNLYNEISAGVYLDLSSIGTAAMLAEETSPGKLTFSSLPPGDYWIAANDAGEVDTIFRARPWTAKQIMQKFGGTPDGLAKIPAKVRDANSRGNFLQAFTVRHAIYPNEDFDSETGGLEGNKPFKSVWWMNGVGDELLHEGGYWEFPVMVPRWDTVGTSPYGYGPGWYALGDCQMLQHHEEALLVLLDKIKDPPMVASDGVQRPSLIPGSVTYVPEGENQFYKSAISVDPRALQFLESHIDRAENRISQTYYVHLWQMLVQDSRAQPATATEIEYKRQEAMLMLGPLLENLNHGLLEPLVMRAYYVLDRADMLPLPPPELEGQEFKVEFTSIMHQMQEATGLAPLRTLIDEVRAIYSLRPDVVDKINADAIVDDLHRIVGAPPDTVYTAEEVAEVRGKAAAAAEAKEQGEAMATGARAVRDLGQADPDNLKQLASAMSPAIAAQGGALAGVRQ